MGAAGGGGGGGRTGMDTVSLRQKIITKLVNEGGGMVRFSPPASGLYAHVSSMPEACAGASLSAPW